MAGINHDDMQPISILLEGMETGTVKAWVRGSLAVHRAVDRPLQWTITHLPTGYSFGHRFRTAEAAVNAMDEIGALRDEWEKIADSDIPILQKPVVEICARHGGRRDSDGAYAPLPPTRINGYSLDGGAA